MRKIISLLSLLSISGATMPMVVAAAPYEKNDASKLEKLHRVKRGSNKKKTTHN